MTEILLHHTLSLDILHITMRDYELVVLIPATDNAESTLEQVKKTVEQNNGKVVKVNNWGRKPLAYPIAKQIEAGFFNVDVALPAESVSGLNLMLRVNENLLRHLLLRKESNGKKVVPVRQVIDNEGSRITRDKKAVEAGGSQPSRKTKAEDDPGKRKRKVKTSGKNK